MPTDARGPNRQRGPENYKHVVAREIRRQILTGELGFGDRLDQDAIGESLGVSRLPVREAIILLAAEGLIDNRPHRGAYVTRITESDVREHFVIFGVLSGLAAHNAAQQVTEEELDQMKAVLHGTEDPGPEDRALTFHSSINHVGAGHRLRQVLRMVEDRFPLRFLDDEAAWVENARSDHEEIYEAIAARDPQAAEQAMRAHMARSGEMAIEQLQLRGIFPSDEG